MCKLHHFLLYNLFYVTFKNIFVSCIWTAGVGKGLYTAFYTALSRPCERFTVILSLTGFQSQHTVVIDIIRRIESEGGEKHKKEPRMRYNVPVQCSPIWFIPALHSARTLYGPRFNPLGRGQLPLRDVKRPKLLRSLKGLQSE